MVSSAKRHAHNILPPLLQPKLRRFSHALITASISIIITSSIFASVAHAHHLLPKHSLQCSKDFPCADWIKPRVRFWVEVFRRWDRQTAILHDKNRPERVYAVFGSRYGCSRRSRARVARYRHRLKQQMHIVADKIERGKRITTAQEFHLVKLFSSQGGAKKRAQRIRHATQNIRCQSGVRDDFIQGLHRFHHHSPMVDKILKQNNLPYDLRYLPFVESSYNPAAYSRVGAAGMWQIMPTTARHLGLKLNATLDERMDPEAATHAAAKYFIRAAPRLTATARKRKPSISQQELNPFLITSYNYGVSGMKRAIRDVSPNFKTVLEQHSSPRFKIAVKSFYASFLAARHVAINAEQYFGDEAKPSEQYQPPQVVVLQKPVSYASIRSIFGLNKAQLRPLNRTLTRYVWNGLRVMPTGYRLRLPPRADRWQKEIAQLAALPPQRPPSRGDRYTVRRGDTACGIAKRLRVSCRTLIRHNGLNRVGFIRVGQVLRVPRTRATQQARALKANHQYTVRRGDTACGIAKRLRVSCRTLIRHNGLNRIGFIRVGQVLRVPRTRATQKARALKANQQYTVRRGDTACSIAKRLRVKCRTLIRHNGLNRAGFIRTGQVLRVPGTRATQQTSALKANQQYTVRRGDTACGIAKRLRVECRTLIRHNGLNRAGFIRIGQVLRVPGTRATQQTSALNANQQYTVRRGDSACHIAERFAVQCNEFLRVNNLTRRTTIHPGQKLNIPGRGTPQTNQTAQLLAQVEESTPRTETVAKPAQPNSSPSPPATAPSEPPPSPQPESAPSTDNNNQPLADSTPPADNQPLTDTAPPAAPPLATNEPLATTDPPTAPPSDNESLSDTSLPLTELAEFSESETLLDGAPILGLPIMSEVDDYFTDVNSLPTDSVATALDVATLDEIALNKPADEIEAEGEDASVAEAEAAATGTEEGTEEGAEATTEAVVDNAPATELRNLLDTLPPLSIQEHNRNGKNIYTVRVEADETLGHFGDWLGLSSLRQLRELNNLRRQRPIRIGQRLRLPIKDAKMAQRFELRRIDYHQILSESLKENYNLIGTADYTVQQGDSLWILSRQLGLPLWLLDRLNPTLRDTHLKPGNNIRLPKLIAKAESETEPS